MPGIVHLSDCDFEMDGQTFHGIDALHDYLLSDKVDAEKLFPNNKIQENALQEQRTTKEIPRTGTTGENISKGSQGVRPSEQGQETTGTRSEETKQQEIEGEGKKVGVSHAALTELAQKLGLKEPERGQFQQPEWYAERGRKLLANGASPDEVNNPQNELHDRIAIARAHLENLVKDADAIGKSNKDGIESEAYKKALEKVEDYGNNVVKKLGTLAHRAFESLQGQRDIDTDSFTSVKRDLEDLTGKKASKEQEGKIKQLTEDNQRLKKIADDAEAKLIEETEKAFNEGVEKGKKLSKTAKAKNIADKLREAAKLHRPDSFSAGTPVSVIWDAAVEVVAKSIEAGGKIADAIDEGVKYIRESDWYKSLNKNQQQKAENDFSKFNYDNAPSSNLEDLQGRFLNKKGNDFTREEAKDIWSYAKETYLDNGVSYRETISKVADDLGLNWRQVSEAFTTPKTKRISDEMWKRQADYRRNQTATKTWIENQDKSTVSKVLKYIPDKLRGISVFGHGGIFVGTHAGMTLFNPTMWDKTLPAFFRGWKYAYGNTANYERAMEALKNSDNYLIAQRAGLKNNPDRINAEEFQKSQQWLGKLGLAGERGFNAIKVLRQDLFDYHYNKLSDAEKQDPASAESIARLVNNATGATNLNIPNWINELTFAGGMESSRWAKLTRNPAEATVTAIKALVTPDKATTAEKVFAKVWARRVGEQLATYAALLAVNSAMQKMINPKNPVNWTDPSKGDWLLPKFGDINVNPTSGMLSVVHFINSLFQDSFKSKKERHGDTVLQADAKNTFGYLRGKLAPGYSTLVDLKTGTDFSGNTLPFNQDKPQAGRRQLTWKEYAEEKLPIPVAEGFNVAYQSAQDNGLPKPTLQNIMDGIISGSVSFATGFRASENKEKNEPFTDQDKKQPAFKYFIDKGLNLPNTSLSSELITDEKKGTKKPISSYPDDIQKKYQDVHKKKLNDVLNEVLQKKVVYIKSYKDAADNTTTEVSLKPPTGKYKAVLVDKLTPDEYDQVLHLAQTEATKRAKKQIFGQ